MENIQKILQRIGVEIPKEKTEEFNKAFNDNYKTISEVDGLRVQINELKSQNTKYSDDLKTLQEKIDIDNVDGLKATISELQANYDKAQKDYAEKLKKQEYQALIKEKTSGIKFTSNSAKKAFENDLLNNPLSVKDGMITGFDDFLNSYREADSGAFVTEEKATVPQFTTAPTSGGNIKTAAAELPKIW